jgi:hypothetical protein
MIRIFFTQLFFTVGIAQLAGRFVGGRSQGLGRSEQQLHLGLDRIDGFMLKFLARAVIPMLFDFGPTQVQIGNRMG